MPASTWLSRSLLYLSMTAWVAAMMCMGGLALFNYPHTIADDRVFRIVGPVLIASGQYFFALIAARVFPLASRKVTTVFEFLPWVVLVGFFAGGQL